MKILYNTVNPEINDVDPVVVCPCCLKDSLDSKYTKRSNKWTTKTRVWLMQYTNTVYTCPNCGSRWCTDDVVVKRKLRKQSIASMITVVDLVLIISLFVCAFIVDSCSSDIAAACLLILLAVFCMTFPLTVGVIISCLADDKDDE